MINLSDSSKYNSSSMYLNESIIESTLNIINAESSDVGRYTCEAANIIGTDESSGILSVNGKYPVDIHCLYYAAMYTISLQMLLKYLMYLYTKETVTLLRKGKI